MIPTPGKDVPVLEQSPGVMGQAWYDYLKSLLTVQSSRVNGTTTNDSAAAGVVGEYIESVIPLSSAVALSSGSSLNVTSIGLSAGDWDVSIQVQFLPAAATSVTRFSCFISLVANTADSTVGRFNQSDFPAYVPNVSAQTSMVGPYRLSLNAAATVYCVANSIFTISTMSAYGIIRARRVR